MKAILCQRFGTPDDLVLADIPDPAAGPGEVVAKVVAVGLNFFDTLIIAGKYQTKPPFPFSPGGEFAGVVESVGAGVTAFKPGDRVMGYTNFNAARERTAVAADHIVKLPADLDFDRAAALTITYGTAYYALKYRALMRPQETLAVLGASGGVGLAAVETGSVMGARVIACASTDDKLVFARAHGAHEVVNYEREDLREALKRLGGEHGVDVKGCAVLGVFWGAWVRHDTKDYKAAIDTLAHWCAEGKLSCHVQKVYPLAELPAALKALANRQVMGKLVVRV